MACASPWLGQRMPGGNNPTPTPSHPRTLRAVEALSSNPAGPGLVCAGSGRQQPESQTWRVPSSARRGGS
ncbi:galectin 1 [Homo sapiens]|uniref:Galectin 1 n=1 Tax=Homo sapiens TaxID=9606 RepID=F8WCQ5_HUMAN|nr:galectin 1 [Homo sapiens]KAI4002900.1 galectin 1 [Homo sapiens]